MNKEKHKFNLGDKVYAIMGINSDKNIVVAETYVDGLTYEIGEDGKPKVFGYTVKSKKADQTISENGVFATMEEAEKEAQKIINNRKKTEDK